MTAPIRSVPERTMIEFFAGIGLVYEALRPFGWHVLMANDNDPKKIAGYRANFPESAFDSRSISELSVADLPSAALATASFPCVDLSQAGNRGGIHAAASGLVWDFLDKIGGLRAEGRAPSFLLIENVPNLLSINKGASIDVLLEQISSLGYAIDLVQVDAQHFTPQSRNRVFIIGVEKRLIIRQNSIYPADHPIRRYKVREAYERNAHLPWHFFHFPPLPRREVNIDDIVERLPNDHVGWWNDEQIDYFWRLVETEHRHRLQSMLDANITAVFTAVRRLRRRHKREQIFNVRFDGLASCLRTPKGGSSTQYVIELREGRLSGRRLLPIEAARLQGVGMKSDVRAFNLVGSDADQRFALGDAVCVPAVRWVAEHSVEVALRANATPAEPCSLIDVMERLRA